MKFRKNLIRLEEIFGKIFFFLNTPIKKVLIGLFRGLTGYIRTLPDFIIIGVARCGTTSLYKYLIEHPYIKPASTKEVDFFADSFKKGIRWYKAYFPTLIYKYLFKYIFKCEFITGEASTYYIFHPYAIKRIFSTLPNVKIIVILRNPVDRWYSHYFHGVRAGSEKLSPEEAIKKEMERLNGEVEKLIQNENYKSYNHRKYSYLARGIYIEQIKKCYKYFPENQILILNSEDFYENSPKILKKVFQFLNIPNWNLSYFKKYNYSNNPKIDDGIRNYLINYYKPYNQRLFKYLKLNFKWDN